MSSAEERIEEALAVLERKVPFPENMDATTRACLDNIKDAVAILRPPPKRHTFGGVPFVETGTVAIPAPGQWFLSDGCAWFCDEGRHDMGEGDCPILRYAPEEQP